jgi:hypothetical protein
MMEDPMAEEDICEAMELCFGTILQNWENTTDSNTTPILLCCFASLVFNNEWIFVTITTIPRHLFSGIPIINRPDLLRHLYAMVTISSDSKLMISTRIPPHKQKSNMGEQQCKTRRRRTELEAAAPPPPAGDTFGDMFDPNFGAEQNAMIEAM